MTSSPMSAILKCRAISALLNIWTRYFYNTLFFTIFRTPINDCSKSDPDLHKWGSIIFFYSADRCTFSANFVNNYCAFLPFIVLIVTAF